MDKEKAKKDLEKYGSMCTCGHIGDKENSEHKDRFQYGHGACKIEGCWCNIFTWAKFNFDIEG